MRADWDDDLSILSAENVSFAVETAGLGTRFAAVLIDMTLQFIVLSLMVIAAFTLFIQLPPTGQWINWASSIGGALLIAVVFLISYGYFFFFEWLMDGQTPGKRWLHLRVLQTSAMPATVWNLFVRNLLRIIDFMPFFYGAGALVAVLNPHNRRIGDLVAGTLVARERPHGARRLVLDIDEAVDAFIAAATAKPTSTTNGTAATPVLPGTTSTTLPPDLNQSTSLPMSPLGTASRPAQISTGTDVRVATLNIRLSAQDYELAREFLLRRDKLQGPARQRLAHSLATRLCQKLGEPLPPPNGIEPFLERITQLVQANENAATEAMAGGTASSP